MTTTVATIPAVHRFTEKLGPNQKLVGLDKLVDNGTLLSYAHHGDEVVVYAKSADSAAQVAKLERKGQGLRKGSVLQRASELFVPPDWRQNCAPEYPAFRLWQLAGSVASGAIGFMNTRLNLDVLNINFPGDSAKAATAGAVFGLMWKGASMAGSFLAKKGDIDPRKCFLISGMFNVANALSQLVILSTCPHMYTPLVAALMTGGALFAAVGSSAGINVSNHIAKENARGLVQAKNSNQDSVCDTVGMSMGVGLGYLAASLSVNPYLLTAAIAGPIIALCTLQGARCLRMEKVDRAALEKIVDNYIDKGSVPEAPRRGFLALLKSVFFDKKQPSSERVHCPDNLEEVVAQDGDLLNLFTGENYLLSCRDGQINMAFKQDSSTEDMVRAFLHARLIERGLDSPLRSALERRLGPAAAERTLVDLAGRALPNQTGLMDGLSSKGWHLNPAGLDVEKVEGNWNIGGSRSRMSLEAYMKLLADPSEAGLDGVL